MTTSAEVKPELPTYMDSTMRSAFVSCEQKFFKEFVLGLRPADTSIHLHAGGAFSGTLERFYKEYWEGGKNVDLALARSHNTFDKLWGSFVPYGPTPKTRENMWTAVEGYVCQYPPNTDEVQPYFVNGEPTYEFSFAIPLDDPTFPRHPVTGDPFVYVGRADCLGTYLGRPVIRDEKTAGRLESNWSEQWDLRGQFLGYCWAAQKGGIDCKTVVVRGVIITTKQVRQVEAIKLYSQWEIDRWYEQLRRDLIRLCDAYGSQWWSFALADACTNYGGCSFAQMCKSENPDRWLDQFKVVRWNPLLRNPINEEQSLAFPVAKTVHIGQANPGSTSLVDATTAPQQTPGT